MCQISGPFCGPLPVIGGGFFCACGFLMIPQVEAAVPCVASCALRADSSVRNYRNYSETIVICNDVNVRNLAFVTGMAV